MQTDSSSGMNQVGIVPLGADPLTSIVANPNLLQSLLVPALTQLMGMGNAQFKPQLGLGIRASDAMVINGVNTPLQREAQALVANDFAGYLTGGLSQSGLAKSSGAMKDLVGKAQNVMNGSGPVSAAAQLGFQTMLSSGAVTEVLGGNIPRMADLGFTNRDAFANYGGYGSAKFYDAMDPDAQAELARRSTSFTRSVLGMTRGANGMRDRNVTGRFTDDQAEEILLNTVRSGARNIVTRSYEGNNEVTVADRGSATAMLGAFDALSAVVGDDKTPAQLQGIIDKMTRSKWATLDAEALKSTFQRVGHFAKSMNVSGDAMVSAMSNVQDFIQGSTGKDVGIQGAQAIVQRGIARASEMGITDPNQRWNVVQRTATLAAEGLDSTAGRALIQLRANQDKLSDAQKALINNNNIGLYPDQIMSVHRQIWGEDSGARIRNRALTTAEYSTLDETERAEIDGQVNKGQRKETSTDILGNMARDAAKATTRALTAMGASASEIQDKKAQAAMRALDDAKTTIFSSDAAVEADNRAAFKELVAKGKEGGLSDAAALAYAARQARQIGGELGAGIDNLIRARDTEFSASVGKNLDSKAIAFGIAKRKLGGSDLDTESYDAAIKAGRYEEAQAMLKKAGGGDALYKIAMASAAAETKGIVKQAGAAAGVKDFLAGFNGDSVKAAGALNDLREVGKRFAGGSSAGAPTEGDYTALYNSLVGTGKDAADVTQIMNQEFGVRRNKEGQWENTNAADINGSQTRKQISAYINKDLEQYGSALSALNGGINKTAAERGITGHQLREDSVMGYDVQREWGASAERAIQFQNAVNAANPTLGMGERVLGAITKGGDIPKNLVEAAFNVSISEDASAETQKQAKKLKEKMLTSEEYKAFSQQLSTELKGTRNQDERLEVLAKNQGGFNKLVQGSFGKQLQDARVLEEKAMQESKSKAEAAAAKDAKSDKSAVAGTPNMVITGKLTMVGNGEAKLEARML